MLRRLSFNRAPKKSAPAESASAGDNPFASGGAATYTPPEFEAAPPAAGDNPFGGSRNSAADGEPPTRNSSGPFSPRSPRSSVSESVAMPRRSLNLSGISTGISTLFIGDPDKNHDKKVSGLDIDPSIATAKANLRKLRDAVDATATFYLKYAERKKGAASGHCPLLLPEIAEWSRHEAFCGAGASSEQLHRDAAQLAAIEELVAVEHATIAGVVMNKLHAEAKGLCDRGLEALQGYELEVLKTSHAQEAAKKALKKGTAAKEAAENDARKATALKDEKKRPAAQMAAERALTKAAADIEIATAELAAAETELGRLAGEAQPVALEAAGSAQADCESGPIAAAAEGLAEAYRTFARGAAAVLSGEHEPSAYDPTAKRKAPKETSARFAAYVVQWTLAKRRGKAAAALLDECGKAGVDTLLSPPKEHGVLAILAGACEDAAVGSKVEGVALGEEAHANACAACKAALGALSGVLGDFRLTLKAQVSAAEEFEKKARALRDVIGKRDALEKEIAKLSSQAEGGGAPPGSKAAAAAEKAMATLEKKRGELAKIVDDVAQRTDNQDTAASELEAFAAELGATDGDRSVQALVANPLSECVRAYGALCATRADEAFAWDDVDAASVRRATTTSHASAAPVPSYGGLASGNSWGEPPPPAEEEATPSWAAAATSSVLPDAAPLGGRTSGGDSGGAAGGFPADNPFASSAEAAATKAAPDVTDGAYAANYGSSNFEAPNVSDGAPPSDNPFAATDSAVDNPFNASSAEPSASAALPAAGSAAAPVDNPFDNPFGGQSQPQPAAALEGFGAGSGGSEGPSLPAGWSSAVDPTSGKTYYHGPDGQTSWTPPEEASI